MTLTGVVTYMLFIYSDVLCEAQVDWLIHTFRDLDQVLVEVGEVESLLESENPDAVVQVKCIAVKQILVQIRADKARWMDGYTLAKDCTAVCNNYLCLVFNAENYIIEFGFSAINEYFK